MTRSKTGTVFIILALLMLMALGGLSRYWGGTESDIGDWVTAGEDRTEMLEKAD
jgi:hypothetical protein